MSETLKLDHKFSLLEMESKFKDLSANELYECNGGSITKTIIGIIILAGIVGVGKGCTDAMDSDKCGC